MKKLKAVHEENQFERLPGAMVIEILDKLVHLKHLLRCWSVCKRFGSLIDQIQTIIIPSFSCYPTVLGKFSAVRSIHMHEALSGLEQSTGLFVKYKAMFRAHLDVIVVFISLDILKSQNVDSSIASYAVANFDHDYDELMFNMVRSTLNHSLLLHDLARYLVSHHPVLAQLLINTSLGKLCMGKDGIAELRTAKNLPSPSETFGVEMVHCRLELAASGRVIPHAYIAVARPEGEEIVMEKDLGLMLGSFHEDNDHDHENDTGKMIDEMVDVMRKKIASDQNED